MHAVRIHEHGGPEVLTHERVDDPQPAPDEVVVEVQAVGINPFDTYVRDGSVSPPGGLPRIIGSDIAGEVGHVGSAVEGFTTGDRVFATGLGLDTQGAYAELVAVPAHRLAHLPAGVEFEAAAAGSEPITTALQALERGAAGTDSVCLIQGATGGVGHVAVQVATQRVGTVLATCHPDRGEHASRWGADAVFDYRDPELATTINAAVGANAVDVIIETHAEANIVTDVAVLSVDGRVVVLGETDTISIPEPTAGLAKRKGVDLRFMSHMATSDAHAAKLAEAARLLERGDVEVVIAASYPLDRADEAHRHCMRPGVVGKVILTV